MKRVRRFQEGFLSVCVRGSTGIYSAYPHSTAGSQVEQVRSSTFQKKALER